MIPHAEREAVFEAFRSFDEKERGGDLWLENGAQKFAVVHEGAKYPPKRIISLATGTPVSAFSGGSESNDWLRERGFDVISLQDDGRLRFQLAAVLELYGSEDRGPFGKDAAAYQAVTAAGTALGELPEVTAREDLRVKASAGTGNWARVPWIAAMDQTETTSTQHGIYVVYLFREDMSGVYLTFNQGVTQLFDEHRAAEARRELNRRADSVRELTPWLSEAGFVLDNESIDLRTRPGLGKRYEESTIAHKFYEADAIPDDAQLRTDLDAVLTAYDRYISVRGSAEAATENSTLTRLDTSDDAARVEAAYDWIRAQGYHFEPWHLATFVAAARTKPFIILAGVSGTGKSKLPQLLATATTGRVRTVPVRPDWTDSTDLLGYQDLRGAFRPGELLRFCRELEQNPEEQGICVIDEMNLARVEYYFAEVLSRIEDDRDLTGGSPLLSLDLPPADADWGHIELPANLLLVGTVNMDESTHAFSKKVLDRAFTLEFSRVSLADWEAAEVAAADPSIWTRTNWQGRARRLSDLADPTQRERQLINSAIESLEGANALLQQAQMQVGYRVRDELALFLVHADPLHDLMTDGDGLEVDPLDVGLSMKLLPRISGGSNLVRRLLTQLLGWAWQGDPTLDEAKVEAAVDDWLAAGAGDVLPDAQLPRTAARLCLMWQRLQSDGFTSYWL